MIIYEGELKRLKSMLEQEKRKPVDFQNESAYDPVKKPFHYNQGGIEVYDFIKAYRLNYALGNVIKYVARAQYKNNYLEDLQKAKQYLEMEIKHRKENGQ